MNLPPYVFDVDYLAKIRSGLSLTEKNSTKLPSKKWPGLDLQNGDITLKSDFNSVICVDNIPIHDFGVRPLLQFFIVKN